MDEDEDEEEEEEEEEARDIVFKYHYVWIKNLSRLCSRQLCSRRREAGEACDRL